MLGPQVPKRGNAFSRAIGRIGFRSMRFHFEGSFPDVPRSVIIVAPHTSNWDFVVGIFAMLALGLRLRFVAKHTLFWEPFGSLLCWLGGIAVDRHAPGGVIEAVVEAFRAGERLHVAVTPEGTRKKVEAWKTGFHRIARAAGVPILPVAFDYRVRAIVFQPLFHPTRDYEVDLKSLRAGFTSEMAYRPERY
jgi:1-acyl-sn-glycerol-3-phosphate acyltransferase